MTFQCILCPEIYLKAPAIIIKLLSIYRVIVVFTIIFNLALYTTKDQTSFYLLF